MIFNRCLSIAILTVCCWYASGYMEFVSYLDQRKWPDGIGRWLMRQEALPYEASRINISNKEIVRKFELNELALHQAASIGIIVNRIGLKRIHGLDTKDDEERLWKIHHVTMDLEITKESK